MNDGKVVISTALDNGGFKKGVSGLKSSLKGLTSMIGVAFSVAAVVAFGAASVKAASALSSAMTGLNSIVEGQGRSFQKAKEFIDEYISDGLVPATQAVTAYKNLAMRGYNEEQIKSTMIALKDSAAFGRQASLELGQAVAGATEGLKNENSILVDNAGVTKNVSMMWKDYANSIGVSVDSLTKAQKIQAEVAGILQETRFQTGDAARVTQTYAGQVQMLSFGFNNLKIAFGNALIPILQAVLPTINAIVAGLTRVFNLFAQVSAALFGKQVNEQAKIAATATAGAKAEDKLAKSTEAAGKAAKKAQLGFDELNIIQSDTGSGGGGSAGGAEIPTGGAIAGGEIGTGVTLSPDMQTAADNIVAIVEGIKNAIEPTKKALQGLWEEMKRFGSFTWDGLVDFYEGFLKPVGTWVLGEGLPRFVDAITSGLSLVDWGNINQSLSNLWDSLAPFAVNVGEGLLWLWENVLVPFGTWVVNDVVPVFLDLLAGGIDALNSAIEAVKPVVQWLWDNFLEPIASWTGGVIVSVLKDIELALWGIGKWITDNKDNIAVTTGIVAAFFAAWSITTLGEFIVNGGGVVGVIGLITTKLYSSLQAFIAVTAAKVADKIETAAIVALYVKDFFMAIVQSVINIAKETAAWVASTVAKTANALAQTVMTAATVAWNAIGTIATAVTTAFGAAVNFLTSPIGLVVLAIGAVIAIVVLLIKHWEDIKAVAAACWDKIKEIWSVVSTWFNDKVIAPLTGFFSGLWDGIKNKAAEIWEVIKSVWLAVATWFNDSVVKPISGFFGGLWGGIKSGASALANFMKDKVITPIVNLFKGLYNSVIGIVEGIVNGFIGIINTFIRGINFVIDTINKIPGISLPALNVLPKVSIPRLAQGAVIPPNREFMAVLGDQKSGMNIEAPEGLIRKIMREEMSDSGGSSQDININFSGSMAQFVRMLKPQIERETRRRGTNAIKGGI